MRVIVVAIRALSKGEQDAERGGVRGGRGAFVSGVLGGLKGGKARAAKLTKKQRSDIAKKAAAARWKKASD